MKNGDRKNEYLQTIFYIRALKHVVNHLLFLNCRKLTPLIEKELAYGSVVKASHCGTLALNVGTHMHIVCTKYMIPSLTLNILSHSKMDYYRVRPIFEK